MSYVDCFVIPVPKKKLDAYRRLSQVMIKVWLDSGAVDYVQVVSDDVKTGKQTSFPQSVNLKTGEAVVVGWVTYKSRAHRDRVNAKAMKDERLAPMMDPKAMPFDGMRMFMGGFEPLGKAGRSK